MPPERDLGAMTAEFVEALVRYLKQRGAELATAVVVEPLRKAAVKLALGCGGAVLLGLGIVFFGIFLVRGFAALTGGNYTYGYLATSLLVLTAGLLLLWLMSRPGKGEEGRDHGEDHDRAAGDD